MTGKIWKYLLRWGPASSLADAVLAPADGSIVENILTVGASYVRPVGVEHNIINNNDGPYSFIEVELK